MAATADQAEVTVFVAAQDIPPNTLGSDVLEQGLLTTERVSAGAQPVGAISSAAGLDNQIFAVGVPEGEIITSSQLAVRSLSNIQVPEGFDGVAVVIPYTNGGAGYVAPGDIVNVYGVFGSGDGAGGVATPPPGDDSPRLPRTELIITNVRVLDVSAQQATSAGAAAGADEEANANPGRQSLQGSLTYLLALRPADVERVVQASNFAELYLSLTAENNPPAGDTPGSDGGSVIAPVSAASAAPQG